MRAPSPALPDWVLPYRHYLLRSAQRRHVPPIASDTNSATRPMIRNSFVQGRYDRGLGLQNIGINHRGANQNRNGLAAKKIRPMIKIILCFGALRISLFLHSALQIASIGLSLSSISLIRSRANRPKNQNDTNNKDDGR